MPNDELHRQWDESDAKLQQSGNVRWNSESYRVAAPRRLARPESFKKGGTVKKTGWALVHKGERVLTMRAAAVLATKIRRRKRKRKRVSR